ncbi:NAD-dependent epimerase/dehydratase family protein [Vandammella animalimorsus]|uniref:NAD-dependent epimerase/dehydratase family protein n=1 Tax=Vandammella animalimorsus TaxID=2029117 RepID=A0A3M6RIL4_9BURK|nr:NAD-dependent epimerase/dehydratase family protein [Vandammella animalimorsus]RMX15167.1 NAD-dependent epimerase/dehydratase family protein [Vandammella animalimorsus]
MTAPASSTPSTAPTVLLCGANGFIGRHIAQALHRAGWQVRAASRHSSPAVDFTQASTPAHWAPLLHGAQAVVNAVGLLRDSRARPMTLVHDAAPRALFDACAAHGLRRVVQISALGIAHGATAYARTKRAADAHLLALTEAGQLDGVALRPSLVFGAGGESTRLFMALARLPWLALPRPVMQARVQPLAVWDLADAVARLLPPPAGTNIASGTTADNTAAFTGLADLAGPQAMTMAEYIALLRTQLGEQGGQGPARPARIWPLPHWLTRASARLGDALPFSPWCSQSLALLASDNVADAHTLPALLGRPATPPARFIAGLAASAGD